MLYDAKYFGNMFVAVSKTEQARRSYKNSVSVDTGHIPYDTGKTQNSIYLSQASTERCTVEIGGDAAPYAIYLQYAETVGNTSVPNRHRGFVGKFARRDFVTALRKEFGEVKIS